MSDNYTSEKSRLREFLERRGIRTKICSKCKIEKPIKEFGFRKASKNGIDIYCKECNRENTKTWAKKHPEKIKEYREEHKEHLKKIHRIWREKNKEIIKIQRHVKYLEDKEKRKEYLLKNRKKINEQKNARYKKNIERSRELDRLRYDKNKNIINAKRMSSIQFRIVTNLRNRVRSAIKHNNGKKILKTINLIGCTISDLKIYLEKQFKPRMTWKNYTYRGWHIDHIKPCASFDLTDPAEQKKCFHYTNLQPLWWHENIKKGAKINE